MFFLRVRVRVRVPKMPNSAEESYKRLLENATAVIISFVSGFFLADIVNQTNRLETTLIVVLVVLIWIFVDGRLRDFIKDYPVTKRSQSWRDWIWRMLDFLLLLSLFLVARLILFAAEDAIQNGDLSIEESIGFIFVGLGVTFAFIVETQRLTTKLDLPPAPSKVQ